MSHFIADSLPPFGDESSSPQSEDSEQRQNAGDTSTHLSGVRQLVILVCFTYLHSTCIDGCYEAVRATDLILGLRRIPAGFYVKVQGDDIQ
jgi:hypothetical protein